MTVAAVRSRLRGDRQLINKWLVEALELGPEVPTRLATAMRYAVLGRAKRLRAILALESFRAAGGRQDKAVKPLCTGIEMVQAFSLAHDDLPCMDDDDYRRGKPSLHKRFDEAIAVLAGDALLVFGFELIADCPVAVARREEALRVMLRALGPAGMAGGQMLDLEGQRAVRRVKNPAQTNRLKTAAFIAAAVEAGAVLAGAPGRQRQKLREAGLALGMLFQATDDQLDAATGRGVHLPVVERRTWKSRVRVHRAVDSRVVPAGGEPQSLFGDARRTERMFAALGPSYGFLAALPEIILNRRQ